MYCNIGKLSCIHFYSGKARSITYAECVFVALCIEHEMRMRHIVICGLSGCTIFFHFVPQTARFSKKAIEHNVCIVSLQHLSETFLILRRTERDMIINVYWIHVKHLLFLSNCNETWIFSPDLWKILNIKFYKIPSSGYRVVSCARKDGRTCMAKLRMAFHNFTNAPVQGNFQPFSQRKYSIFHSRIQIYLPKIMSCIHNFRKIVF